MCTEHSDIGIHVRRFEVLPTILDPQAEQGSGEMSGELRSLSIKSLSRSASQPVVFPRKHLERRLNKLNAGRHQDGGSGCRGGARSGGGGTSEGGADVGGGGSRHEDDLDIIKQIIEKDETLQDTADQVRQGGMHFRSQSLSHIPGEFSSVSSLPTLHHAESMHLLHSNYFSAPDFSQLQSPPSFNAKHGGGAAGSGASDVMGGDLSYHPLTHESRSSSLGDCHSSLGSLTGQPTPQQITGQQQQLQQVSSFDLNGDRRGSGFDSQQSMAGAFNNSSSSGPAHSSGLALSQQGDGFNASSHVSSYDFARHRDSGHSLSYSESDGNQTPSGYDLSRRESGISDGISTGSGSMSFQFPSLARTANPQDSAVSSHLEARAGGSTSSNLPLRDYLTSQTNASLIASISRVENPSLVGGGGANYTGSLDNSKGTMCFQW